MRYSLGAASGRGTASPSPDDLQPQSCLARITGPIGLQRETGQPPVLGKGTNMGRTTLGTLVRTLLFLALVLAILTGCSSESVETDSSPGEPPETTEVILASTTSTQDSGLFDVLIPAFHETNPTYEVKVIAVGTGEALTMGENKDADILLVHAKTSEEEFVAEGYAYERQDVMYNDFIIAGPAGDPAGAGGASFASAALAAIMDGGGVFYSRGDDSGTNKKELALWEIVGVTPEGDWYKETGQGMGDTLRIASEKQSYTLTDRATYLNLKDSLDLEVAFEGADDLFNQYGVLVITDATNEEGAQVFAEWIVSDEGQAVIEEYGIETFGEPLFVPNAE